MHLIFILALVLESVVFGLRFYYNNFKEEETDSEDEFEANEETALETYTTPLDEENSVDEYIIFKEVLQSKLKYVSYNLLGIENCE